MHNSKENVNESNILAEVRGQDRKKNRCTLTLLLAYLFLLLGTASGGVSVHVLLCFLFISTLLIIGLLCLKNTH